MTQYHEHIPVMLQETTDALVTDPDGIYIDGTLGGGGHSERILSLLSDKGRLYGIDQDDEALEAAGKRLQNDPRFLPLKGNFGYLSTLLPPQIHGQVAGILLDLGVSTHQLKEGERGFSFQKDGPLDMRMGNLSGVTAYQVVNEYDYDRLKNLIFHYGEEKASRKIAKAIIASRPLDTTGELAEVIRSVVPERFAVKSLARVFQAIRIEVNRELKMLEDVLQQSLDILKTGGRLAILSYHSLEDRIVKYFFRSGNLEGKIKKDFYGNPLSPLQPVNRQVITPSEDEVRDNPAARSAKLRVAERIEEEEYDR